MAGLLAGASRSCCCCRPLACMCKEEWACAHARMGAWAQTGSDWPQASHAKNSSQLMPSPSRHAPSRHTRKAANAGALPASKPCLDAGPQARISMIRQSSDVRVPLPNRSASAAAWAVECQGWLNASSSSHTSSSSSCGDSRADGGSEADARVLGWHVLQIQWEYAAARGEEQVRWETVALPAVPGNAYQTRTAHAHHAPSHSDTPPAAGPGRTRRAAQRRKVVAFTSVPQRTTQGGAAL